MKKDKLDLHCATVITLEAVRILQSDMDYLRKALNPINRQYSEEQLAKGKRAAR